MNEMIGHIFGSIEGHDKSIKYLIRALNNQAKFDRHYTVLAMFSTIWMFTVELRLAEQDMKIDILNRKIEELKEE